jgi:cAMP-dependent protein kinase regulator
VIIKQGDEGECLFFVGEGTLDCSKIFPDKEEPTFLLAYRPGMVFGELALLYNAPR